MFQNVVITPFLNISQLCAQNYTVCIPNKTSLFHQVSSLEVSEPYLDPQSISETNCFIEDAQQRLCGLCAACLDS